MLLRPAVIGALFVLGLAVAAVAAALTAPSTFAVDGIGGIITRLQAASRGGDERAAAALDDLENYARAHGLEIAELKLSEVTEERDLGALKIEARGQAPLWLNVVPTADISTHARFAAYLAARRLAAAELSQRLDAVNGRLTSMAPSPLNAFFALRDTLGATVTALDVDMWLDGSWVGRIGIGPEQTDLLAGDASSIETSFRGLIADAHAGEMLGRRSGEAVLTVHVATVRIPSDRVKAILDGSSVLAFDPIDDMIEPFAGLAAHVQVIPTLDALDAYFTLNPPESGYPFVPGGRFPSPRSR